MSYARINPAKNKPLTSIFPTTDSAQLLAATPLVSDEEMLLITDHNIFRGYFKHLVNISLTGHGLYCDPDQFTDALIEVRPQLTKIEALLLLQQIDNVLLTCEKQKFIDDTLRQNDEDDALPPLISREELNAMVKEMHITNLLFLPESKAFIFCAMSESFYLGFGEQPIFQHFGDKLKFNSDFGFYLTSKDYKYDFLKELNTQFKQWKENNFAGNLFEATSKDKNFRL